MPNKTIAYTSSQALPTPVVNPPALTDVTIDLSQGGALGGTYNIFGSAKDPNDAGAAFTWAWAVVYKPAGSAAAFNNAAIQNPTFGPIDVVGNYRLQLVATSSGAGGASEGNKVKAPKTAFVEVRVKTAKKALQKPANYERDWMDHVRKYADVLEDLASSIAVGLPYTVHATADGTPTWLGYQPGSIELAQPAPRAHMMFYFKDATEILSWSWFLGDAGLAAESYSFKLYAGTAGNWQAYAPNELANSVGTGSPANDNYPKGVTVTPNSPWAVAAGTWVGVVCTAAPSAPGGQLSATLQVRRS